MVIEELAIHIVRTRITFKLLSMLPLCYPLYFSKLAIDTATNSVVEAETALVMTGQVDTFQKLIDVF